MLGCWVEVDFRTILQALISAQISAAFFVLGQIKHLNDAPLCSEGFTHPYLKLLLLSTMRNVFF
jgi:hypothetical protein